MTMITTKLVKDGNSMAVRLSKPVLAMSGLSGDLEVEVRKGQITISSRRSPRADWRDAIKRDLQVHGKLGGKDDYGDLNQEAEATLSDGLT
jgi:antitoxin component of MazEF toxin-antitoxin module